MSLPEPVIKPPAIYKLGEASILDLNGLRKLETICFPQDAWPLLDLIAVLSFPGVVRIKAVSNGKMVGFIAGDPKLEENIGWIATVGVLPEYRGQGIGHTLITECENRMPMRRIRLSVRVNNTHAIELYEKIGYQRINEWEKYYSDGGNALVMEKIRPADWSSTQGIIAL
jgi:ribosomal protein S18 acetylase RimI-like enzyme